AALCGSAPHGVTVEMYRGLLKILKENCPIVLADASGKLLAAAIDEGVDFIKPNRLEIAGLMGKETVTNDEIIEYCRGLLEKNLGSALVSLGGEGALYISKEGVWRAQALKVDVKSTLGCGDTMVASSLISLSEKEDGATLLKKASALASANAAHPETARFDPAVYKQLLEICHVEKL
ncbi:MAG: 1-phosphofructokinase, partial [Clostridia bacterium]|nr:1-phosphofructokinase [Clostridia bacterium]